MMGVLNVTPDSFSDGGLFVDRIRAVDHVSEMIAEGADIVDIGGESSRPAGRTYGPGAEVLSADEEKTRVVPVVKAVVDAHPGVVVSVDTYKADVAEACIAAGARMVNDITGFRGDDRMPEVVAKAGVPVILMHSVGAPGQMPQESQYDDVIGDVRAALSWSLDLAEQHGITQMIVDPGFGFGKSVGDNLRLVAELSEFAELGHPILIGVSRKSSIGAALEPGRDPRPVDDRLFGSLAATAAAVISGAAIVRTHDVAPTRDLVNVLQAIASTRFATEVAL